ncbi:MAG TPA: hypothetical protein VM509_01655 [Planctomycetota bacterium]|nr:hypothetical protein [Planctomycetota bacterium]
MKKTGSLGVFVSACAVLAPPLAAQVTPNFVNWETPHVHPLELTPDRTRLLAVNTPDGRVEVFDVGGALPLQLESIPVGIDPVSVRARTNAEIWVVNQLSDSVSIVDLASGRTTRTLATDDEPADVVFTATRAFVSCSQSNTVLVFTLANLAQLPTRIALAGQDPRALTVAPDGSRVYAAIFQSGNSSTVIGGITFNVAGAFPPNAVSEPAGPHGGANPPPNGAGNTWVPPFSAGLPTPPPAPLIVKKNASNLWVDDRGANWTSFISGSQSTKSGRPIGWDLSDNDIAVINANTLSVSYARRLMNACMSIGVVPSTGEVAIVGTEATNEVRFEPNLNGRFVRVKFARINALGLGTPLIADLNPHLSYATATVPQSERDKSLGDPRAIVFRADGARGYVAGMGSNNVIVIDTQGQRVGLAPTIQVGEGPTGLALDEVAGRLYVLDKLESALSVVDTASETEIARVAFHDASPAAIRAGRKHFYATRTTSGLGQAACASCHIDGRADRLAWDLGNPAGTQVASTPGQNLGGNVPGLNTGFTPFHPMKGPMVTQTFQDIIGKEPHHWRGDRTGLEAFSGAFTSLLGDDAAPTPAQMQEFEDFVATITFPPNPNRALDNTLKSSLALPGHFTTGRFAPAGQPLPAGNPQRGLKLFRPPNLLDGGARACVSCHTLPTGMGTDFSFNQGTSVFNPFPVGPQGEHHHAIVAGNGVSTITLKIPHLRALLDKQGFNTTQLSNTSGFGLMHDGTVDSIERLVAEPIFDPTSDQDVADLTAFLLSFSGSDLPGGSAQDTLEPPGTASKDTPAAVGKQVTIVSVASAPTADIQLIGTLAQLANANKIGLTAHLFTGGLMRGFQFTGTGWQSDRAAEFWTMATLMSSAAAGSELTLTAVARGTERRLGVDRDLDGEFDRDELDHGTDPADAQSNGGICTKTAPALPTQLVASQPLLSSVQLDWNDVANDEDDYRIERALSGSGAWSTLAVIAANSITFTDPNPPCPAAFDYRVSAQNCAGSAGAAHVAIALTTCCGVDVIFCSPKTNSLGCVPAIDSVGQPSASLPGGFAIRSSNVRNKKPGLLLYGTTGPASTPFHGGTLCVQPPVRRSTAVDSGGNAPPANDCSGVYTLDMNAFASGALGGNPFAGLVVPGTVVQTQWWGRDNGFTPPDNIALSDALRYTVCP